MFYTMIISTLFLLVIAFQNYSLKLVKIKINTNLQHVIDVIQMNCQYRCNENGILLENTNHILKLKNYS